MAVRFVPGQGDEGKARSKRTADRGNPTDGCGPLDAGHHREGELDPDARLFVGPRGGRISTAVLRDSTHWDEVVNRLGHEHLRRHDLRHTGLTWMADAGVPVPVHVLRKIAGHGSLTTTQRYLHPDQRSIKDAGTALSAHLTARRSPNGPHLQAV
jgi:integrase